MANLLQQTEPTNYQHWQVEKYGNALPELEVMPDGTCENGEDEMNRAAEWANQQAETQLEDQTY